MKKIKILALMLMAASVSITTVSCGDDSPATSDTPAPNPGGDDTPGDTTVVNPSDPALSAVQAKQRMEQVARELINKLSANEFANFQAISDAAKNTNAKVLENWLDACLDACCLDGSTDKNLKRLYAAANFTGEFKLSGSKWIQTNAARVDYLQLSLTDKDGKACVMKVETGGNLTRIHHEAFDDDYDDGWWDSDKGEWHPERITEENAFMLPEYITITLTQGGGTPLTAKVHTVVNIAGGDFDYTRDAAQVEVAVQANDYLVQVGKAAFNAGKTAEASATVTKGGETLLEATAKVSGVLTDESANLGGGSFVAKVLGGKVRVEGTVKSGFQSAIETAYDNRKNESVFKQHIDNANALMNVSLFFDGSRNYSGKMELYPLKDTYGYGSYRQEEWYTEPFVKFNDGTRYSYQELFDETTYKTVIRQFENLVDSFASMFGDE